MGKHCNWMRMSACCLDPFSISASETQGAKTPSNPDYPLLSRQASAPMPIGSSAYPAGFAAAASGGFPASSGYPAASSGGFPSARAGLPSGSWPSPGGHHSISLSPHSQVWL